MVKLSAKFLIRKNKTNKNFLVRKKGDTDKQFLSRIIYLTLQNQFIEQILKIDDCKNVQVLYLQNNLIKNIENMSNFPLLTHLYLQRNFIEKIENLEELIHLKKIYLGRNEIQVLEGMETLRKVQEIHLESQDIPKGGTMYFEPLTIQNLGATLCVLNISDNCVTSIKYLKGLINLRIFIANDNFLRDINDIISTIIKWEYLKKLSLLGNEVTESRWYRDAIIFASKSLEILDNRSIHPNTRIFIEKLIERKKIFYMKQKTNAEKAQKKEKQKTLKFADDIESKESCLEFTNTFPLPEPLYLHPPWRLRSNVNSVNQTKFLPRPYWRKGGQQYNGLNKKQL